MAQVSKDSKDGLTSAAGGIAGLIIVLVVLFIGFLNAPGMVVMGIIQDFAGLHLDYGQMWTFSILISLFFYVVLKASYKDSSVANAAYILLCLAIAAIFIIANFGFKASFPGKYIGYFINI